MIGNFFIQCKNNEIHNYSPHLSECPWCKIYRETGKDPFDPSSQKVTKIVKKQVIQKSKPINNVNNNMNYYLGPSKKIKLNQQKKSFFPYIIVIIVFISLILPVFFFTSEEPREENILKATTEQTKANYFVNPLEPTSTDKVPDYKQVWIQIQRDPLKKIITVKFEGASNIGILSKMEVRVTTPSGKIYSDFLLLNNEKSTITVKDNEDRDRVEVFITFADNTRFKVKDEIVPIKNYS